MKSKLAKMTMPAAKDSIREAVRLYGLRLNFAEARELLTILTT